MIRIATTLTATTLGLLLAASAAAAPRNIDLSGMDCAEKALHLREIIETNEVHEGERENLEQDVTRAQQACRNGDEQVFADLATKLENRNWAIDEEPMK